MPMLMQSFLNFSEEDDLYVPLENDLWLVRFLRPTKFYPESARDLVSIFYSLQNFVDILALSTFPGQKILRLQTETFRHV